jgi:RNA polymerase II-associated protein 1
MIIILLIQIAASTSGVLTPKKLRFADITEKDVHVYESAPPSPKRRPLALPPPDKNDDSVVSIGQFKGKLATKLPSVSPGSEKAGDSDKALDEGTPEDIRRKYFPHISPNDPANKEALAWIQDVQGAETKPSTGPASSDLRFDLTGTPIPSDLSLSLPTHLGLHHHAEGSHAGYTLDDIFLLTRSTVPAQRITMLDLLARLTRKLWRGLQGYIEDAISELSGQEEELRRRIIATGLEALGERGSLGARSINVIWECIVGWDQHLADVEGVELRTESSRDTDLISSLPLDFILPQISKLIGARALPPESLNQLLSVVHRLAQHDNAVATSVVATDGLIDSIVKTFLLLPHSDPSPASPNPAAIQLLVTLTMSSRRNATALIEHIGPLLRFVAVLPEASPWSASIASSLAAETLRLYAVLATYGLCTHTATTASLEFIRLSQYVRSPQCNARKLKDTWLNLLNVWIVCAIDPHRTTPEHEVLWSHVSAWGWGEEVMEWAGTLSPSDTLLWKGVWNVLASYLEGAKVNGVKGGENERVAVLRYLHPAFTNGVQAKVLSATMEQLRSSLDALSEPPTIPLTSAQSPVLKTLQTLTSQLDVVSSSIRLWLACFASQADTRLPESPPFVLPFAQISQLAADLVSHSSWSYIESIPVPSVLVARRSLTNFLSIYLSMSQSLPGISEDLWMAQALSVLPRLIPGDEAAALNAISILIDFVTPSQAMAYGWKVPPGIWQNGGLKVIRPMLEFPARDRDDGAVAPRIPSPHSIQKCATQRVSILRVLRKPTERGQTVDRLPLPRDWTFSPVEHLLRSDTSPALSATSPTSELEISEVEVVRASLLLSKISWEVLRRYGLVALAPSTEEIVFGCMKVFMLERDVENNAQEVFRDNDVYQLMCDLLTPLTSRKNPITAPTDLEKVTARFLGTATPFYQYYTDFVALYDSVSFADQLFAKLLLPPTSMRYSVDYRRYLWDDFGHIIKTIHTPIEEVVTSDISEYLWPRETDNQVLGAYLRSLLKEDLQGFVRFQAIHHLACAIWPNLRASSGDDRAVTLLKAIVMQGDVETIKDVVLYHQSDREIVLPPACFEDLEESRAAKFTWLKSLGDECLVDRLTGLLNP